MMTSRSSRRTNHVILMSLIVCLCGKNQLSWATTSEKAAKWWCPKHIPPSVVQDATAAGLPVHDDVMPIHNKLSGALKNPLFSHPPSGVLLSGDALSGKSWLLHEFGQQMAHKHYLRIDASRPTSWVEIRKHDLSDALTANAQQREVILFDDIHLDPSLLANSDEFDNKHDDGNISRRRFISLFGSLTRRGHRVIATAESFDALHPDVKALFESPALDQSDPQQWYQRHIALDPIELNSRAIDNLVDGTLAVADIKDAGYRADSIKRSVHEYLSDPKNTLYPGTINHLINLEFGKLLAEGNASYAAHYSKVVDANEKKEREIEEAEASFDKDHEGWQQRFRDYHHQRRPRWRKNSFSRFAKLKWKGDRQIFFRINGKAITKRSPQALFSRLGDNSLYDAYLHARDTDSISPRSTNTASVVLAESDDGRYAGKPENPLRIVDSEADAVVRRRRQILDPDRFTEWLLPQLEAALPILHAKLDSLEKMQKEQPYLNTPKDDFEFGIVITTDENELPILSIEAKQHPPAGGRLNWNYDFLDGYKDGPDWKKQSLRKILDETNSTHPPDAFTESEPKREDYLPES